MNEADLIRTVRGIIRQELEPIRMARMVTTKDSQRGTARRFKTDGPMANLRLIQPYGFASRPPDDMDTVLTPVAGDVTHLNITGQFDADRPALAPTESCLYGPEGQIVFMKVNGDILIGSQSASEPLVLGNVLKSFTDQFLTAVIAAVQAIATGPVAITTTPGNPAPTEPALVTALEALVTQLTELQALLVDAPATNFLSQANFTERGT